MISRLLAPFVTYILAGTLAVSAFAGVQTWRIGRLKYEANVAAGTITALQASKNASEALRGKESARDTQSFTDLQTLCLSRLSASVGAGRTIERIVNAPANPDGSRGLCDDECLRSIMGEEAGSSGQAGKLPG